MYFQWAAWEARKHLRAGVTCSVTCHWCHLLWHVEVLKMCLIQSVFQWPWRWASLFLSQSFSDKWLTTAVAPYGNFRLLNCLTTDTINIQILAVELEKKKKEETTLVGLEIIPPELRNKFTHRLILQKVPQMCCIPKPSLWIMLALTDVPNRQQLKLQTVI